MTAPAEFLQQTLSKLFEAKILLCDGDYSELQPKTKIKLNEDFREWVLEFFNFKFHWIFKFSFQQQTSSHKSWSNTRRWSRNQPQRTFETHWQRPWNSHSMCHSSSHEAMQTTSSNWFDAASHCRTYKTVQAWTSDDHQIDAAFSRQRSNWGW